MTDHRDRNAVRRLAREYNMLEEDVRHMLAFENGYTTGDVKEGPRKLGLCQRLMKAIKDSFARNAAAYRYLGGSSNEALSERKP